MAPRHVIFQPFRQIDRQNMASTDDTHDAADEFFRMLGRLIDLSYVVVIDGEPELTPRGQETLAQLVAATTPKAPEGD